MKVYLSGPMTGIDNYNRQTFNAACDMLRSTGYEVYNPAELNEQNTFPFTWNSCIKKCIVELINCDMIVLLPGWMSSKGARLEVYIAQELGIEQASFDIMERHIRKFNRPISKT